MAHRSVSFRRRMLLSGVPSTSDPMRRLVLAFAGLVLITVIGTIGYMILGLSLVEAVYQTVFTVATVGYTELYERSTASEVFTIFLIVAGVGMVLYNLGVLVEAVTEGQLREHLWRRRMEKTICGLRDHLIIVGYGRVGRAAAQALLETHHKIVAVDADETRFADIGDIPFVLGDAAQDDVLRAAGIDHARAMICALDTDADTMYATLSARTLRPDMVIISRARTVDSREKLVRAGATRAVNPQLIGGRRMASFALHGDVAEFLDEVLHQDDFEHGIEQVRVRPDSPLVGRSLGQIDVRAITGGAQVLALRAPNKGAFHPNPPETAVVESGSTLIVLGTPEHIDKLRVEAGVTP